MNVKRKEAALNKLAKWKEKEPSLTDDDLKQLLEQDDEHGMYPKDEVEEIMFDWIREHGEGKRIQFIGSGPSATVITAPKETALDLSAFDYTELKNAKLIDYIKLAEAIPWNERHDYQLYKCEVIKQPRYEGVPNSPIDITGIRITDNKPLNTTSITAKRANILNGFQLRTLTNGTAILEGAQVENTKRIYLLKK